jgi:hypothetical protein
MPLNRQISSARPRYWLIPRGDIADRRESNLHQTDLRSVPLVAIVLGSRCDRSDARAGTAISGQSDGWHIEFEKGNGSNLPFESEPFESLRSRYAFHPLDDPEPVFSELARVFSGESTRPGRVSTRRPEPSGP